MFGNNYTNPFLNGLALFQQRAAQGALDIRLEQERLNNMLGGLGRFNMGVSRPISDYIDFPKQPKTFREELQRDVDEWLKDSL